MMKNKVVTEPKRYSIDEVFSLIGEDMLMEDHVDRRRAERMEVDGFSVRKMSLRYMTFYQKGTKCVTCGKEGTHFLLRGDKGSKVRHFELYADDGTLMTKDHIIPRSKGGKNNVSNLQTMCEPCNIAKWDKMPEDM